MTKSFRARAIATVFVAAVAAVGSLAISGCTSTVTPNSGELDEGNANAIGITSAYTQGTTTLYVAEIALINRTDLTCGVLQSEQGESVEYSNFRAVGASITSPNPITPGTYSVSAEAEDGSGVQAFQEHTDAKCATDIDDGVSGQVILTRIDGTALEGSFDFVFQSGSHLKGAFNAPACPLELVSTNSQATACK